MCVCVCVCVCVCMTLYVCVCACACVCGESISKEGRTSRGISMSRPTAACFLLQQ